MSHAVSQVGSRARWSWLSCCLALALAPGEPFLDLSYEQALARSKEQGKLMLVDATASWCPPCKRMEKETWPAESVRTWLAAHAVTIQIDVDDEPELARSLKIEGMPTVVAFKDGIEFDRIVGFRDTAGLMEWLDGVAAGKRSADTVREKAASLEASTDVDERYELARELLQQREYERALKEYMWLWPNTRKVSSYGGVRLSFMLSDIRRLCDAYEPAREAFTEILDVLDLKVVQGRATDYEDWSEWFRMNQYLEGGGRVIAFYESHHAEDGRLDIPRLSGFAKGYVTDEFFDVLMQQNRMVDAARLFPDLQAKAQDELADSQRFDKLHQRMYAADKERLARMEEYTRRALAQTLGRLHAAALAVGRRDEAQRIGELLIAQYDDSDSRTTLVEFAVAAGCAGPEHRRWVDEAEHSGASVGALRAKLPALDPVLPAPEPARADPVPTSDDGN